MSGRKRFIAKAFANETGSALFLLDLESTLRKIGRSLAACYNITFVSPSTNTKNGIPKIKISCERNGVTVYAPKEYYVPVE